MIKKSSGSTLNQLIADIKGTKQHSRTRESSFPSTIPGYNSEHDISSYDQDGDSTIIEQIEDNEGYGYQSQGLRKSQSFGDQKKGLQLNFDNRRGRNIMTFDMNDAGLPVPTFHSKKLSNASSSSTSPTDRRPSPAAILMTPLPKFDEITQKNIKYTDRMSSSSDLLNTTKRGRISLAELSKKDQNKSTKRIAYHPATDEKTNTSRRKISSYANSRNISDRYLRSLANWADKVEAADKKDDVDNGKNGETEPVLNPV